jgi:hypothetical protein
MHLFICVSTHAYVHTPTNMCVIFDLLHSVTQAIVTVHICIYLYTYLYIYTHTYTRTFQFIAFGDPSHSYNLDSPPVLSGFVFSWNEIILREYKHGYRCIYV